MKTVEKKLASMKNEIFLHYELMVLPAHSSVKNIKL